MIVLLANLQALVFDGRVTLQELIDDAKSDDEQLTKSFQLLFQMIKLEDYFSNEFTNDEVELYTKQRMEFPTFE